MYRCIETKVQVMNSSIQYGSKKIDFHLIFSDRKSLGVKVNPDLSVQVTAPENASLDTVEEKVKNKASWIIKQQNYFQKFHPMTPPKKYISGETHLYLGRQYRLKIHRSLRQEVKLKEGFINIYIKSHSEGELINNILDEWYKERARIIFTEIFDKLTIELKKRKISPDTFIIRNMKKRWGSCTPGKKIIVNPELIKAPMRCIEYVFVHEMCHLKYYNHSESFYKLQSSIMSDWKFWKNKLEIIMS